MREGAEGCGCQKGTMTAAMWHKEPACSRVTRERAGLRPECESRMRMPHYGVTCVLCSSPHSALYVDSSLLSLTARLLIFSAPLESGAFPSFFLATCVGGKTAAKTARETSFSAPAFGGFTKLAAQVPHSA